jgi:hypothetical protein
MSTSAALALSAYRGESGSSSAARQTPYSLSQKADHHGCCWRKLVICATAVGVGRLVIGSCLGRVGSSVGVDSVDTVIQCSHYRRYA